MVYLDKSYTYCDIAVTEYKLLLVLCSLSFLQFFFIFGVINLYETEILEIGSALDHQRIIDFLMYNEMIMAPQNQINLRELLS